jgi:hypothetical protein
MTMHATQTQVIEASDDEGEVVAVAMWSQVERKDDAAEEVRVHLPSFMQHLIASKASSFFYTRTVQT